MAQHFHREFFNEISDGMCKKDFVWKILGDSPKHVDGYLLIYDILFHREFFSLL